MPSARQKYGGLAEDQAVLFLRQKGFTVIGRHVTSRYGEIDILARDGATIVAVEVKARRNYKYGRAAESVTEQKLEKIAAALADVMTKQNINAVSTRIDLITIEPDGLEYLPGLGPAA